MSLDKSLILLGEDIVLNEIITLKQPTVREVIRFGVDKFFSTFYTLSSIPSDMKSFLWEQNIDFMKISDWELFISLTRTIGKEDTKLILGDLDLSSLQIGDIPTEEGNKIILYSNDIVLTEEMYLEFIPYIREMVGYVLKREKAKNKATKLAMIEEDRINRKNPKNNSEDDFIHTAVISLVNTEEFPYTYETVMDITVYKLLKSFYQIQNKKSACALYQGSMSGFVDMSKVDKKNLNWLYTNDKKS